MDIVSRLKKFLAQEQIPVTQFADNCGIARPTISQLLNGRNKKVSDDIVRRIHVAYPSLSVMWLMFGEGEMYVINENQHPSPAVNNRANSPSSSTIDLSHSVTGDERDLSPTLGFGSFEDSLEEDSHSVDIEPNSKDSAGSNESTNVSIDFGSHYCNELDRLHDDSESTDSHEVASNDSKEAINDLLSSKGNISGKKIVNIIVYYDDNSYEAFVPR